MVAACKEAGAKINRQPTVAVADAGGHLLHLERPDRNGVNTVEMSTLKARGAARPPELGLRDAGEGAAGVGVSGIGHDDEPVAKAGAEAFGG